MKLFHASEPHAPHRRQSPGGTLALIVGLMALITVLLFMRHAYAEASTTGAPVAEENLMELGLDPEVAAERLQRAQLRNPIGG